MRVYTQTDLFDLSPLFGWSRWMHGWSWKIKKGCHINDISYSYINVTVLLVFAGTHKRTSNKSYLIPVPTQWKRTHTCQIVYFYCLIVYCLSRIQYNLSLVSMLLKFVDWTSVILLTIRLTCWLVGGLVEQDPFCWFDQISSDSCYSLWTSKRLH